MVNREILFDTNWAFKFLASILCTKWERIALVVRSAYVNLHITFTVKEP